jgi:hypothetical protein
VRQIAVEAPTVSAVLGHPTAVRPSTGAWKTVRGQVCLPRTRSRCSMINRSLGHKPIRRFIKQHAPKSRPFGRRSLVAPPRYSWHE